MGFLQWSCFLEDEAAYNKEASVHPPSVVAAEPLLIPGIPFINGVPDLLEHVDVRLMLLLDLLFIIEADPSCVDIEVERDDNFSPIDEEERCVTSRSVHAHPKALEQGHDSSIHRLACILSSS